MHCENRLENVLTVRSLVKNFGVVRALDGVSFSIGRGVVLGLLGPNGAGKTTCIDILLGSTLPNAGKIEYFGEDFFTNKQAVLRRINFASAYHNLQFRTSVRENLQVFAHLYEVSNPRAKIDELVSYFQIEDIVNRRFGDLSAGQRTRVSLIKSLLNEPDLLLMDEPTASLDPDIADKTLSLIETLRRDRELSILFTSHNMDEVTRICDEVIFLNKGRIEAQGTPRELMQSIPESELRLSFEGDSAALRRYFDARSNVHTFEGDCHVAIVTRDGDIPRIINDLGGLGIKVTDIDIKKPDLQDVFLQIARRRNAV